MWTCFNSRPCERGDENNSFTKEAIEAVSIHAPARGATAWPLPLGGQTSFNSRPCERGDALRGRHLHHQARFNSRPCERGDRDNSSVFWCAPCFNSRPCERGDPPERAVFLLKSVVSIHAPVRGATSQFLQFLSKLMFQFTPL